MFLHSSCQACTEGYVRCLKRTWKQICASASDCPYYIPVHASRKKMQKRRKPRRQSPQSRASQNWPASPGPPSCRRPHPLPAQQGSPTCCSPSPAPCQVNIFPFLGRLTDACRARCRNAHQLSDNRLMGCVVFQAGVHLRCDV